MRREHATVFYKLDPRATCSWTAGARGSALEAEWTTTVLASIDPERICPERAGSKSRRAIPAPAPEARLLAC